MAPPSKLTPERQQAIVESLRQGNYFEQSARASGIDPRSAYRWMDAGENVPTLGSDEFGELDMEAKIVATAKQPYREFREAVLDAIAEFETGAVRGIMAAAAGKVGDRDWRAALEILQRRFPDRWGRTDKIVIEQIAVKEITIRVVGIVEEVIGGEVADPQQRRHVLAGIYRRLAELPGAAETPAAPA